MADREKVIKGLELLKEFLGDGLPGKNVVFNSYINIVNDAIELLKEQEPVEPTLYYDTENAWYICGVCKANIQFADKYCHECGRPVKWDA